MTLIEQVQTSLGIEVDGNAGPQTWNAIYSSVSGVPKNGVACISTIFGLNYDGSPDLTDNGVGAFIDPQTGTNYDTTKVVGVSVPIPVLWNTIGGEKYDAVSKGQYYVTLYQPRLKKTYSLLPIVDLGPGETVSGQHGLLVDPEGNGHYLDRTYPLCVLMSSHDDEEIIFWINGPDGKAMTLGGLDSPHVKIGA